VLTGLTMESCDQEVSAATAENAKRTQTWRAAGFMGSPGYCLFFVAVASREAAFQAISQSPAAA